ncbi:MAG: DUF1772 domain-containing protein [Candidatus Sulfotelmatobacter sp.]|jgi:uncharacterized membrane protein
MILALEFVALFSTALFVGAALYVNLVEHPARMECGTAAAVAEFVPSYRRAVRLQASLAILACLCAFSSWWLGRELGWLVGTILIGFVGAFTLIIMLPTNQKLVDPDLNPSSERAHALLVLWARLHAVRTVCSLAALLIFLVAAIAHLRPRG